MLQGEKNCIRGCEQMLFSSLTFLFCFLPATVGIYYLVRRELRNIVLLLASILFYAWGEIRYLPVIFMTIGMSYAGALCIEHFRHKRIWLTFWVLSDLSLLLYFKYTNFFLENLSLLFQREWTLKVVLPLGISFYTFQALSYLVDVYRGQVKAQRNFLKIALYIILFPQLIAGPIVKYHDIAEQIDTRQETIDHVYYGIRRFIIGLARKVLIGNTLGIVVDKVINQPVADLDTWEAWLGAIFYAFQIYNDFGGYADMAIGLCAIFGFRIHENFHFPLLSQSYTEFWHRWHISLGTFVKDYIYIPMGGSHCHWVRHYFNLFAAFFIIGIWHGADMNMMMLGVYNGVLIIIEKITKWSQRTEHKVMQCIHYVYMVPVLCISYLHLRSPDYSYTVSYILNMFGVHINRSEVIHTWRHYLTHMDVFIFLIALVSACGVFQNIFQKVKNPFWNMILDGVLLLLLIMSVMQLAESTYNPFIYFRF